MSARPARYYLAGCKVSGAVDPRQAKGGITIALSCSPCTVSPFGINAHLHNAAGDVEAALAVKRDLAARLGWEIRSAGRRGAPGGSYGQRRAYRPSPEEVAKRAAKEAQEAEKQAREQAKKLAKCKRIWEATLPTGEPMVRYLLGTRGLMNLGIGEELADAIRFHPALGYYGQREDGSYRKLFTSPAMVAMIRDCQTGKSIGLHRFYLSEDGKLHPNASNARKTLGPIGGGCIRLGTLAPDGRHAVAEGLESAMAFTTLWGIPCDSALNSGELKRYTPPAGCTSLVIAADNDVVTMAKEGTNPGLEAAAVLAARMNAINLPTRTLSPKTDGDWNDYLWGKAQ